MSSIQPSEECLDDLLHFSECFTSNKEECPDHNEKCTQLRVQYNHAIDNLNDFDHYNTCEICQHLNHLIQLHHKDCCCLKKCVFRTVARFYIFARHYLLCDKKAAKRCKFCRDNHTLFKIMETYKDVHDESFDGICKKTNAAITHVTTCTRSDCWVCHLPYLEKQGLVNEFEPKKNKTIKYKKAKQTLSPSYQRPAPSFPTSIHPDSYTPYDCPRGNSYAAPLRRPPTYAAPDYSCSNYYPSPYSSSLPSSRLDCLYSDCSDYMTQPFTSECIEEPAAADYLDPFAMNHSLCMKKPHYYSEVPRDPYDCYSTPRLPYTEIDCYPDYEYSDYMFHESPYGSAPYDPYPCPRPSRTNYSPYSHAPLSMQEDPYYRRFI